MRNPRPRHTLRAWGNRRSEEKKYKSERVQEMEEFCEWGAEEDNGEIWGEGH